MGKGGWWGDTPMHVVKPYVVTYAVFKLYHPPSRCKNDRCSPMCGHGKLRVIFTFLDAKNIAGTVQIVKNFFES